jgi:hypothetical protein
MGDDYKTIVERLQPDGANWVSYRDRIIWAVGGKGWHEHLTEDSVTPLYTAIGDVNNVTPEMRWNADDKATMHLIASSIPNSVFSSIKGSTTAKGAWDALKLLYEGRTNLILINLNQRLQAMRCGEEENVREHLIKLKDMREQLASMGKVVPDTEYTAILMGSLPKSFSNILGQISASAAMANTVPTPSIVIKLATDEYDARVIRAGNTQDEALAASTQKDKKGKKRDIECFNCHKKGHTRAQCWAKGGGNEGGGPKQRAKKGDDDAKTAAADETSQDIESWAMIDAVGDTENDSDDGCELAVTSDDSNDDDASANDQDVDDHLPAVVMEATDETCELYDSGASRHMSPHRKSFVTYRPISARPILSANNEVFHAIGMGDLQITVPNGSNSTNVLLRDTLHAPDLALTVVSIGQIIKAGYTVNFCDGMCKIRRNDDDETIGAIPISNNGLFKVERCLVAAATSEESVDLLTLHRRLGHISPDSIRALIRTNAVTGIHLIDDFPPFTCDSCEYAKMTRKAIRKERIAPQAETFGDEIHTDLWGPSPTLSLGGRKYYVTFTDDCTRYTKLDILRSKDQAFDAYKQFAAWADTQHHVKVKRLRSDRGGEYTGNAFTTFLQQQGTERRLTTADTPQHNGIAESLNRRLLERVRAMLHQAELPKNLWAEAIQFAVWLKNRASTRALGNMTPYERLYGQKPNLANVPEWGQNVWVYKPAGFKLDARASQARWIGFDADSTHAHRVYWPDTKRVSVERNIKFVSPTITTYVPPPSYSSVTARGVSRRAAAVPPAPPVPPAPVPAPAPVFTPMPTAAPPPSPVTPTHAPDEEEEEVEDTITPRRIQVPVSPIVQATLPRRSARTRNLRSKLGVFKLAKAQRERSSTLSSMQTSLIIFQKQLKIWIAIRKQLLKLARDPIGRSGSRPWIKRSARSKKLVLGRQCRVQPKET